MSKFQISNHKFQTNHNNQIQNSKPLLVIGFWGVEIYLLFGA
jgi:hypothetical protein